MPILVRLVGDDVDKKYVKVTDFTSLDDPIPFIKVSVDLDLEEIA